jgi:hypothetical protein
MDGGAAEACLSHREERCCHGAAYFNDPVEHQDAGVIAGP